MGCLKLMCSPVYMLLQSCMCVQLARHPGPPVCTKSFSGPVAGCSWSHLPLDLMHRIAGSLDTAKDLCNFERVSRACWWVTLVS